MARWHPEYRVDGRKIRAVRLRRMRWRQEDLAEAIGMTTGQVSRMETGVHQPQLRTIEKIAEVTDTPFDYFVEWDVDLPDPNERN